MAVYRISAYRISWTIRDGGRGNFAFEANGKWSNPIALPSSEDVAAVAAIFRGGPELAWDGEHAALICGSSIVSFAKTEEKILTRVQLEGGDGPFPPK
jgi:hypothetical protein